jgi:hypothetical protein
VQSQEAAWNAARAALQPGERLPAAHWQALSEFAFGATLRKADRERGFTQNQAQRTLEAEAADVVRLYRRHAERHARSTSIDTEQPTVILEFLSDRIGDLAAFVTEFSSDEPQR